MGGDILQHRCSAVSIVLASSLGMANLSHLMSWGSSLSRTWSLVASYLFLISRDLAQIIFKKLPVICTAPPNSFHCLHGIVRTVCKDRKVELLWPVTTADVCYLPSLGIRTAFCMSCNWPCDPNPSWFLWVCLMRFWAFHMILLHEVLSNTCRISWNWQDN